MDTNTAAAVNNAVNQGLPVIIEIGEKLPEVAPLIMRNAEGAVQVGKTALNAAKTAGVLFGTGLLIGTGTALVAGGVLTSFWAIASTGSYINKKWNQRKAKKAVEERVKAHGADLGGAAPAPA